MKKPTYLLCVTVEALARVLGFDLFIEGTDCKKFSRKKHSDGSWEFWGLRLHVVVSRLQSESTVKG